MDFTNAIAVVRKNADRMRRYTILYSIMMTLIILFMICFMVIRVMAPFAPILPAKYPQYEQWNAEIMTEAVIEMIGKDTRLRIQGLLNEQGEKEINGDDSKAKETQKKILLELQRLAEVHRAFEELYAAGLRPKREGQDQSNSGPVSAAIGTAILSLGAAAMALYFIQLAFRFVRYYSRLGEFYASQETALIASQGDTAIAIEFIRALSPNEIDIGSIPKSSVDRIIDMAAGIARSKG